MLRLVQIDAVTLGDGQELRLLQRGSEFSIMLGTNELMNSRLSGSEKALAELACARLVGKSRPHVLIGGLGMGFTLRAALSALGADARVTVAELVPAVVRWAEGPMSQIFDGCLDDSRVCVELGDVVETIRKTRAGFDAILLDVDNGPDGLTSVGNDALYSLGGLHAAYRALTPGGVLTVWSSGPDSGFTRRLRQAGFTAEEVPTRANGKRGARHMIWVAEKPGR